MELFWNTKTSLKISFLWERHNFSCDFDMAEMTEQISVSGNLLLQNHMGIMVTVNKVSHLFLLFLFTSFLTFWPKTFFANAKSYWHTHHCVHLKHFQFITSINFVKLKAMAKANFFKCLKCNQARVNHG